MSIILSAEGASKSFGERGREAPVIDRLTLSISTGEFVSLVGPSGCGKTTLLMCLSGLMAIDSGAVAFKGIGLKATPPGLAVVFQDYSRSLLPWKTNLENVVFGMRRVEGVSNGEKRKHAAELLEAVGLHGVATQYPWQLSGGMQQRVAIARGLASRSELLLLDEPLAAVDAQTRGELQDLLLDLARKFNQTCVLVTHDVEEAVYMADRVLVLGPRPTKVVREVKIELPKPRDQLATREERAFLDARHEIFALIRSMKSARNTA